MKKLLIIAMITCFAATSFGQMLAAGTSELKVEGLVDFETADDTLIALNLFYGLFWFDYVEFGIEIGIEESDSISIWTIGVSGEYNFDLGNELVPYLGAGLGYARYDVDFGEQEDEDNAVVVNGTAGAKYFVTENVAVSGALVLQYATEDIFAEQDSVEDTDAKLEVAMRFFF